MKAQRLAKSPPFILFFLVDLDQIYSNLQKRPGS